MTKYIKTVVSKEEIDEAFKTVRIDRRTAPSSMSYSLKRLLERVKDDKERL